MHFDVHDLVRDRQIVIGFFEEVKFSGIFEEANLCTRFRIFL